MDRVLLSKIHSLRLSLVVTGIFAIFALTSMLASHSAPVPTGKPSSLTKVDPSRQKGPSSPNATWTSAGNLHYVRQWHTATLLSNGKVLVAGGYGNGSYAYTAELYDPTTNNWSDAGQLSSTHRFHTATLLSNGKVMVAGGMSPAPIDSVELYDPATNSWSVAAPCQTRGGHTATLLTNGKLLLAGGSNDNVNELYNPATNTWSSAGTFNNNGLFNHTATVLQNGKVLIAGGFNSGGFQTKAQLFNPGTNSWENAGNLTTARRNHTATLLENGKVLVAGGETINGPTTSAELYDPGSNTWSTAGSLNAKRGSHTATLLRNGKVLAAGGDGTGSATSELYDPATNVWSFTAALNDERSLHVATLLSDGDVLVVGGFVTHYLPGAERYNAANGSIGGPKIVFGSARNGGNHDIYTMDLNGTNQTALTNNAAYDDQPKWSPDGTKIAFMSNRDGNFEIYSMNADGGNQTRLTNNPAADGFPAWSPDGTKIAFVNGDLRNPSTFEIYVMNADGNNRTRLTNDSLVDGVPAWSPDGTKIVFMSGANDVFNPNSFEIFVMDADGNNRTKLTSNTVADGQPSYSPDGTKILFASGDAMSPTGIEIFVMNANGSNRTQITTNTVTDGFPAWSPDGTKIIFASGNIADQTTVELFVMNADGSNRTQLTSNAVLDWFADWQPATPVVMPSVQFSSAAYSAGEGDASVVITVNRAGDTSGTSAVDFASSNGTASQAKDYQVTTGTLTFTPGQTSRTFRVLLVDDAFVEGNETVNLALSNTSGALLGSPSAATLTIVDNDTAGSTSPLAKQFVADLTGAHEVPPTNSLAKGGGVVQLSASETTAKVSLIFSGLTNGELIARIHGPSGPETNAPPIFVLPQGSPVVDFIINPTPQNVADLKAALHYINVHGTGGFANGEIRGQLLWNPAEEADFFVRQAYFDFLSRLPDPGGFAFWTNEITQCQSDVQCLRNKRVDVSNAFFYEQEFQQTAAYVLRLYRGAYGNTQPFPNPNPNPGFPNEEKKLPSYAVFVADRARVIGGANLAQKQLELANLFVTRSEFVARYPASLATADQFVDALLLTLQNDLGVNLSGQRTNLINVYNTEGGRGAVMYRLADDNGANPIANQAFIDEEYNRSFVLGQYFGYLRRNPDIPGFVFWLGQVNGAPVRDVPKQHAMVCSFTTSAEFQFRFGPTVTRNNNECPQ